MRQRQYGMPGAAGTGGEGHKWLRTARTLMLDVLNPPVYPDLELDADRLVWVMERLSANTVRLPAVFAYAYYQSQTVPHHPQMARRDVIAEVVEACHAKGFKVIPYFPALQAKMSLLKLWGHETDWPALHEDGTPILLPHGTGKANADIVVLCPRGGAREAARAYVREVVTNHDVDAVYFDGPVTVTGAYADGFCHCPRCRQAFEQEEGAAPPERDRYDWEDPLSIRHCLWQRRDGVNMLEELYRAVKELKDIPFVFNWLDHAAGRRSRGPEMVRFGEGFLVEAGEDFTNKTYASKLGHSMGRAVFNYVGNYNPWSRYRPGNTEIYLEGCSVAAAGGAPIVASGASCYYNPDESEVVRDLFTHIKRNEEIFSDADQVKFIALPYSQHSSDWHIRKKPARDHDFLGNADRSAIQFPDYPVPAVEFNVVDVMDEVETVADIAHGKTPVGPGIICREYGKGKVVYVASGIERMYQDGGIGHMSPRVTDLLTIFSNIIDWLSDGKAPYSLRTDRGIHANLTANSNRRFLHLINYNMPNLERPHSQLDDPVPVENIGCRVRAPEGAEVREVSARVSGERLPFSREGESVSFEVPRLLRTEIVELRFGLRS